MAVDSGGQGQGQGEIHRIVINQETGISKLLTQWGYLYGHCDLESPNR